MRELITNARPTWTPVACGARWTKRTCAGRRAHAEVRCYGDDEEDGGNSSPLLTTYAGMVSSASHELIHNSSRKWDLRFISVSIWKNWWPTSKIIVQASWLQILTSWTALCMLSEESLLPEYHQSRQLPSTNQLWSLHSLVWMCPVAHDLTSNYTSEIYYTHVHADNYWCLLQETAPISIKRYLVIYVHPGKPPRALVCKAGSSAVLSLVLQTRGLASG